MATTSPPTPPAPTPGEPEAHETPMVRNAGGARVVAVGALILIVLIVAYLIFGGGGGATYHLMFAEGDGLVRGDEVQVGGVRVGNVTNIELTKDFKAKVTIHV